MGKLHRRVRDAPHAWVSPARDKHAVPAVLGGQNKQPVEGSAPQLGSPASPCPVPSPRDQRSPHGDCQGSAACWERQGHVLPSPAQPRCDPSPPQKLPPPPQHHPAPPVRDAEIHRRDGQILPAGRGRMRSPAGQGAEQGPARASSCPPAFEEQGPAAGAAPVHTSVGSQLGSIRCSRNPSPEVGAADPTGGCPAAPTRDLG